MSDLDRHIHAHYEAKTLPEDRVASLLAETPARRNRWLPAIATAVVLLIAFTFYTASRDRQTLAQRVFAEVAMNHAKGLSVEVASADYGDVQRGLARLGFDIRPDAATRESYQLVGGRYCSIQGRLAAQLKLTHRETGISHTLYVTRTTEALTGIADREVELDGAVIRLWTEGDRFFGMAR